MLSGVEIDHRRDMIIVHVSSSLAEMLAAATSYYSSALRTPVNHHRLFSCWACCRTPEDRKLPRKSMGRIQLVQIAATAVAAYMAVVTRMRVAKRSHTHRKIVLVARRLRLRLLQKNSRATTTRSLLSYQSDTLFSTSVVPPLLVLLRQFEPAQFLLPSFLRFLGCVHSPVCCPRREQLSLTSSFQDGRRAYNPSQYYDTTAAADSSADLDDILTIGSFSSNPSPLDICLKTL